MASITQSLAGTRCLITGGSRGIGLAIAKHFSQAGGSCVLVSRNEEALLKAKDTLHNSNHSIIAGDVGSYGFWQKVEKAEEIDILVNAAGMTFNSLHNRTTVDKIDLVMQTNLMSALYSSKLLTKNMIKKRSGCIINISSMLGVKGGKGCATYAASKAGMIGFSRALAGELAHWNIRVNTILPGYIETDMTDAMTQKAHEEAMQATPLRRFGTVDEVASAALYLATNKFCTGTTINIDGGYSVT